MSGRVFKGGLDYPSFSPRALMLEPSSHPNCHSTITIFVLEEHLEYSLQELILSALPGVTESSLPKCHI